MYARKVGSTWERVAGGFEAAGVKYPSNVVALWPEADLAKLGVVRVTEQQPRAGERATGWELVEVDGAPVWRPTGTETIPPGSLSRLQFWGLVAALDAAGAGMSARLDALRSDATINLVLTHANTYQWSDFLAMATAAQATAQEIARIETAWRATEAG